ncbi:hypothetical protein CEUSTIGMA_g10624.t1 [Chlamydomonas eustigma]|uniref:Uncharacterized protein n=1 Tax=Chlamydomonas eustigma TaxID=1157962 RepID=A0A250XJF1_9CHLO|nr:hypothetical protein CEUSTIGMA_g10624.t1 [Chlamydomonas eustigma]|eukprot:GAX83198.1 hypothetical protein CEUSTIGMA_g10624.t1 [Chlamydomonas eustigma]
MPLEFVPHDPKQGYHTTVRKYNIIKGTRHHHYQQAAVTAGHDHTANTASHHAQLVKLLDDAQKGLQRIKPEMKDRKMLCHMIQVTGGTISAEMDKALKGTCLPRSENSLEKTGTRIINLWGAASSVMQPILDRMRDYMFRPNPDNLLEFSRPSHHHSSLRKPAEFQQAYQNQAAAGRHYDSSRWLDRPRQLLRQHHSHSFEAPVVIKSGWTTRNRGIVVGKSYEPINKGSGSLVGSRYGSTASSTSSTCGKLALAAGGQQRNDDRWHGRDKYDNKFHPHAGNTSSRQVPNNASEKQKMMSGGKGGSGSRTRECHDYCYYISGSSGSIGTSK